MIDASLFDRGRWAPSTRQAYESFWRDWCAWTATNGAESFPAKPERVAEYLTAKAETVSTASLSGRLACLVAVHKIKRKPLRVNETIIRDAWAEIRRKKGTASTPKMALPAEAMHKVIASIPADHLQDRAVLLVGFKAGMRRSELVALNFDDVAISPAGLHITIRHSKTDKTGKGQTVTIARTGTDLCAVAALEAWLTQAEITSGPIFLNKNGRMPAREVANIAKRWAAAIGIDPKIIGAHSLRSGCITTMQEAGIDIKSGMELSRHVTPSIYLGYAQVKRGMDSAAVKALSI